MSRRSRSTSSSSAAAPAAASPPRCWPRRAPRSRSSRRGGTTPGATSTCRRRGPTPRSTRSTATARPTISSILILQGRSVGGGTTVNWTSSFRTPERDAGAVGRAPRRARPRRRDAGAALRRGRGAPRRRPRQPRRRQPQQPQAVGRRREAGLAARAHPPQRQGVRAPRLLRHGLPARRQAVGAHHLPGRRASPPAPTSTPTAAPSWSRPIAAARAPSSPTCSTARPTARAARLVVHARRGHRAGGRRDQHAGAAAALEGRHRQRRRSASAPSCTRRCRSSPSTISRSRRSTARRSRWRSTTSPIAASASATSSRPRRSTRCWRALAFPGFGDTHRQIAERLAYAQATIALLDRRPPRRRGRDASTSTATAGSSSATRCTRALREAAVDALANMARLQLAAGAREVMTLHETPLVIRSEADIAAHRRRAVRPQPPHAVLGAPDGRLRDGRATRAVGRQLARPPPRAREPLDRRRLGLPHRPGRQPPDLRLRPRPPVRDRDRQGRAE